MGVNYNPSTVLDGLELSLDFANPKNFSYNVHPFPTNIHRWCALNSVATNNCTISQDATEISPAGGAAMRMVTTGADAHVISYDEAKWNLAPANTGETWTASVWVKANTATTVQGPFLFGANAAGDWTPGYDARTGSFSVDTNWKRISVTHDMSNANTRFVQVRLDGPDVFSGPVTIWWDGLQVEKGLTSTDFNAKTNVNGNTATETLSASNFIIHGDDYWSHTPPGTLIEPERTNFISNNTMQGAVSGTPGTLPTNWSITGLGTLTQTVVGTGATNGINYIDIRYSGTTSTTQLGIRQNGQGTSGIPATNGQTWAYSVWTATVGGSTANVTSLISFTNAFDASGAYIGGFQSQNFNTSSTLTRGSAIATLSVANTAFLQPQLVFGFNSGVAIDITLRIGMPQMELGSTVTSVIPTKTEARTRYPQKEGTITFDRSNSTSPKFGAGAYRVMTDNLTAANFMYRNHTWEIWFRINDRNPGVYGDPITEGTSTLMLYQGYHAGFWHNATSLIYAIWWGSASANTVCSWTLGASGAQINQGSWYQLAVSRSGNVFTPYINGVQLGTGGTFATSNVGIQTTNTLWLGKTQVLAANTGQYLAYSKNTIGSARMYTRALSASEILQNFNALRGRYGI